MRGTGKTKATLVACVAGAALMAACADRSPLRIAVVGNPVATPGAVLAVEDINAAGGVGGRLLEAGIVNELPLVTPRMALVTAESLAADTRILSVIGHGGSGTSLAASQVYNARHVPQMAPTTSTPLYTNAGPYSFRLVASDNHQAEFIALAIAQRMRGARVAMLYVNDDYGRALHGFLQGALRRAGADVVYEAPFIGGPPFVSSVGDVVRSLAVAAPDLLVWIGLAPELVQLRTLLRAALPRLRVFGSDGVNSIGWAAPDLAPFAGDWVVMHSDLSADQPALRSVVTRFLPRNGRPLTDGAALTYDAVGVLAAAMRTGARDRAAIEQVLVAWAATGHVYQGITGAIAFDEHGDARPSYVLMEVTAHGTRRTAP